MVRLGVEGCRNTIWERVLGAGAKRGVSRVTGSSGENDGKIIVHEDSVRVGAEQTCATVPRLVHAYTTHQKRSSVNCARM